MKTVFAAVHNVRSIVSQGEVEVALRLPIESIGALTALLFTNGPGQPAFIVPADKQEMAGKQYGVHEGEDIPDRGPQPEPQGPIGPRCQRAVILCKDPGFWKWLGTQGAICNSEQGAAAWVRTVCKVDSRRDFDEDLTAWRAFQTTFDQPYSKSVAKTGVAA